MASTTPQQLVPAGLPWHLEIETKNGFGIFTDAAAVPSVVDCQVALPGGSLAHDAALLTACAAVVSQKQDGTPANIPGQYIAEIPLHTYAAAALAPGSKISISISATVDGVLLTEVYEAMVDPASAGRPTLS